jgi:hypothetical protein
VISVTGKPSHVLSGWLPWKRSGRNTTSGDTVLNPDFKEFIQSLNADKVRYLIVGGYAVALHGYPRYTKDLDIWIDMTSDNASNIIKALEHFGFSSLQLGQADFLVPDQVIQLGYPPSRIDILTTLPGVNFNECFPDRITEIIDGVPVEFIDLANLKKNKEASGRYQDLADLENLN